MCLYEVYMFKYHVSLSRNLNMTTGSATYQQLLLALRPQHGEVDHRSNHDHQHAEHERHQLLPVLLQHAAADVVDAEHCRETRDRTRLTHTADF